MLFVLPVLFVLCALFDILLRPSSASGVRCVHVLAAPGAGAVRTAPERFFRGPGKKPGGSRGPRGREELPAHAQGVS
ncbi:hypothetical protein SCWH03_11770 [Streptomyces pacificus]|uniref:Uncharacterized protein n=1 Tax=Streptomyces pacificus TaxID=2705029 RepID=A0A6A0ARQ6_9ACTN|nr:hypothetical protein SCWH03_11770 [Streptomyces pacificus]